MTLVTAAFGDGRCVLVELHHGEGDALVGRDLVSGRIERAPHARDVRQARELATSAAVVARLAGDRIDPVRRDDDVGARPGGLGEAGGQEILHLLGGRVARAERILEPAAQATGPPR